MTLVPGILFHDRYLLIQLVGSGGMSQVWEVHDTKLFNQVYALKIYTYEGASNEKIKDAFRHEFLLMNDFSHSNLLKPNYLDFDISTGTPYMVMKLYRKGSADKIINQDETAIEEKAAARFLKDAASALNIIHNHSRKIIHQDIKPDNFLIDDDGKFVLSDFGVSIRKRETSIIEQNDSFTSTTSSFTAGQQEYVAPERYKGAPPHSSQDIFSLGVTLYEIFTGVLPFQSVGGRYLTNEEEVPDMSPEFGYSSRLNSICKRCMSPDYEARPTAAQLMDWADFYLKNGYWDELPIIDLNLIKAKKIYKQASLIYNRLSKQSLDEIDDEELDKCTLDFQKSYNIIPVEYPDISTKLNYLAEIKKERIELRDIEASVILFKQRHVVSINDINSIKNRINLFSTRLSTRYYDGKIKELDDFIEIVNSKNDVEINLQKLLAISIVKLDPLEAKDFVVKNITYRNQFIELFDRLDFQINEATEFQRNYSLLNIELDKEIQDADIFLIENLTQKIEPYLLYLAKGYNNKIALRIRQISKYNAVIDNYGNISDKIKRDNVTSEEIFVLHKKIKSIKKEIGLLISEFPSNNRLLRLDDNIANDLAVLNNRLQSVIEPAAIIVEKPAEKKPDNVKSKLDDKIINADKLYSEVLKYCEQGLFARDTLNQNLKKIATSIQYYNEGSSGGIVYVGKELLKAKALQDEIIKNLEEDNKIQYEQDLKLTNLDKTCNEVDEYISLKEFTEITLKQQLKKIENCINIYTELLPKAPSAIGKKRKKANDFKEIILEELRKKRRGIVIWFLRGAAVFGIIFIIGFYRSEIIGLFSKKPLQEPIAEVSPDLEGNVGSSEGIDISTIKSGVDGEKISEKTFVNEFNQKEEKNRPEVLDKQEEEKNRQEELSKQEEEKNRQEELSKQEEEKKRLEVLDKQEEERKKREELSKQEDDLLKKKEKPPPPPTTSKALSIAKITGNRNNPDLNISKPMEITALIKGGEGSIYYKWEQIEGPKISMNGVNSNKLILKLNKPGHYNFQLTVTDSNEGSDKKSYPFHTTFSSNE